VKVDECEVDRVSVSVESACLCLAKPFFECLCMFCFVFIVLQGVLYLTIL